jgi:hypothetical protein
MIPIKVQCGCGQRYAFDVEPVNGLMASAVACPACGVDGTATANGMIAEALSTQPAAPPPPPPPPTLTRLRPVTLPPPHVATVPAPPSATPPPLARPTPIAPPKKATGEFNLGMGILGAVLGAGVGAGAMYGFYAGVGFRFPLLGVGIGMLTGYGAKLLYKGTDGTLGVAAGAIALVAVVGTLFLMYGTFPMISIISVAVSVSMAYRISSG